VISFITLLSPSDKNRLTLLASRIVELVKSNKFDFAFLYLKEATRLTIQALAGNPTLSDPNKVRVKTDMYGLPTIIPFSYRKIMRIFIDYGRGSSGRNQEIKKVSCDLDITSTPLDNNEEIILGFPYKYQLRCIRAVLTLLSIYRVFPTKPKVSLDTITSPQGEYDVSVLPEQALRESVKELVPSLELKVGKSYLIGGESAGPNSKKSI